MGCLITFTDQSARELYKTLAPAAKPQPYLSSRLLNRQIKYVMHKLHRELTLVVLDDLERSLRSRIKDSWGPTFCVILVLCLCIENLQTAADVMVICDLHESGESTSSTREQSRRACDDLDQYPFQQCRKLFHNIYRSHKQDIEATKGYQKTCFNPLRSAAEESRMGFDSCTEGMVRSIYGIVVYNFEHPPRS
jgi:hypothetical protein